MESDGILRQRAAGLGGGHPGGGRRRGALMGSGRLASPAGGPQEALACGLALGRSATVAVRWADRLRERRPSPCGLPSTPPNTHTLLSPPSAQMFEVWGATSCAETNKDEDLKSPSCSK